MHRATLRTSAYPLFVFLLTLLSVAGGQTPASAHAVLLSTAPANRQVLDGTPHEVSLTFSETVDLGLAGFRLLGPDGDTIRTGRPAHPHGNPDAVTLPIPDVLSDGTYTLGWHVVSADTHPVQGAFTFSIGEPTQGGGPASAASTPRSSSWVVVLYDAVRWLSFAGIALLVGTAFFTAVCWPGAVRRRGARRLLWSGWYAVLATTGLTFLLYEPYAVGTAPARALEPSLITATLGTRMGLVLAARTALLVATGVGLMLLLRRHRADSEPNRGVLAWRAAIVLAAGCALAVTWSLATHSAAGSLVAVALVSDVVHLTAMGVWIGGLVVLGAVLLRSGDLPAMESAIPRFSRTALVCVLLLAVTGVFQAWREVGTPPALYGTVYGRILIGKLCLAAVLIALGAGARRWVQHHCTALPTAVSTRRRAQRWPGEEQVRRFGRLIAVEAGIAAVLLGLTAFLVNSEPARAGQAAARTAAAGASPPQPFGQIVQFDTGGADGRGLLAVEIGPAAVGTNELHLSVLDTRGLPRSVAELHARFSLPERSLGPITADLQDGGTGHYLSAASLPFPGHWQLSLTVRTSELDETVVRIPVDVR
ncbi:copper resistance CopC/CopD family protein [Streptomyces sp. NPDC003753]